MYRRSVEWKIHGLWKLNFLSRIYRWRGHTALSASAPATHDISPSLLGSELLQTWVFRLAPQGGHFALGDLQPQVTFRCWILQFNINFTSFTVTCEIASWWIALLSIEIQHNEGVTDTEKEMDKVKNATDAFCRSLVRNLCILWILTDICVIKL